MIVEIPLTAIELERMKEIMERKQFVSSSQYVSDLVKRQLKI